MRKYVKGLVCGMMILSLAVPQSIVPQMAGAESVYAATTESVLEGKCGDNVKYTYDTETKTLTISGTGEMWDSTVYPEAVREATKLIIEKGVTVIGANSFGKSVSVFESVEIADTVTTIKECALPTVKGTVELPASVTRVESLGIADCDKIIIKGDVKGYDYSALGYSAQDIIIHGSAEDLAKATYSMSMKPFITIGKDNDKCTMKNGCILSKDGKNLYYYVSYENTVFIPDTVEKICDAAFAGVSLYKVVLGDNIKEIGDGAFAYSHIKEIKVPKSVKVIGNGAFLNSFLKKVTLNKNVKLGENAFGKNAIITNKAGIKKTRTSLYTCEMKDGKISVKYNEVKDASGYRIFVKAGNKTYKFDTKSNIYKKKVTKEIKKYYESVEDVYGDDDSVAIKVTVKPYKEVKGKKVFGKVSNSKNMLVFE